MLAPYFWNSTLLGLMEPLRFIGWGEIDLATGQLVGITPQPENITSSMYYQLPLFIY